MWRTRVREGSGKRGILYPALPHPGCGIGRGVWAAVSRTPAPPLGGRGSAGRKKGEN